MHQVCPYCDYLFPEPIKRNRKCPFCKQPIKAVQHLHGYKLLTEDEHEIYKYEKKRRSIRNRWLNFSAKCGFYISDETFDRHRKDEFEDPREVIARALIWFAKKSQGIKAYDKASMACFVIGRMLHGYNDEKAFEYWQMKESFRLANAYMQSELLFEGIVQSINGCCPNCRHLNGKRYNMLKSIENPPVPLKSCEKGLCLADVLPIVARDRDGRPKRKSHRINKPQPLSQGL